MQHLPPELLTKIISLAVPKIPSVTYSEWTERQRNLSAFALVNKAWTELAQQLLWSECSVRVEQEQMESRIVDGLLATSDRAITKSLAVTDGLVSLLEITGVKRWRHVEYLIHMRDCSEGTTLATYASFPKLKRLEVWHGSFEVEELQPLPSFLCLRRLVLGECTVIDSELEACQAAFSPSTMPLLSHLSLHAIADPPFSIQELFATILPQITTLAICDEYQPQDSFFECLDQMTKLVHLAVLLPPHGNNPLQLQLSHYLSAATGLGLESLHLEAQILTVDSDLVNLLEDAERQQRGNLSSAQVVLYGTREEVRKEVYLDDLVGVKWSEGVIPFEHFDGR